MSTYERACWQTAVHSQRIFPNCHKGIRTYVTDQFIMLLQATLASKQSLRITKHKHLLQPAFGIVQQSLPL